MKAVNFLEWWIKQDDNRNSFTASLEIKVANLLNQPFKPEMITELFEGWEATKQEHDYSFLYENTGSSIILANRNDPANGDYMTLETVNGENDFFYPEILNDFISDCQRANINLEWKENINSKYFTY